MNNLVWKEISAEALRANMGALRKMIGSERILCPCVKSDAYGHGLVEAGRCFVEAGADWLSVNSLDEAKRLREGGIEVPVYIMGYVLLEELAELVEMKDVRVIVYNRETVEVLGKLGKEVKIHLKLETGNNRQGLADDKLVELVEAVKQYRNIEIEGMATHFANIEDTTDHSYAEEQLQEFRRLIALIEDRCGVVPKIRHCANSAATLLFDETRFEMVRPGIISYGLWPSKETYASYLASGAKEFWARPAFSWKTRVAQVKDVPAAQFVGYGCTYRTSRKTTLAILPVGYYDGYDRGVKGAHVLIHGKRAAVVGRICMNMIMVDVTDIEGVAVEDEVVLIGQSGGELISVEEFAGWAGTINYEVTTRIGGKLVVK
ncbi:alanine racemase [Candidatus Peregrinibacteria bacterium HGW-Peregrinibacteria-1]|jgi:alanine racemase|nr:MAG: alanine racemase [Candidatus Peregrinibacteria bacterium HGW-Peregrinibacteria-1]